MTDCEVLTRLIEIAETMSRKPYHPAGADALADLYPDVEAAAASLTSPIGNIEMMLVLALMSLDGARTQLQVQRLQMIVGQAVELVRDRLELVAARVVTLAAAS